ncbi:thiamine ABC transporter ATP-binding protein [Candidatus Riesia pediculicola]|uniref:thiamine ABC transporter ATP-binding protein n=1 Tax=Candidatus Riesia pediculicola TaxID=401619 RepID=UPI0009C3DC57|nr:ATP-binding cassette domain-containing protein [Candidatus Riesia pediculicola]ARC54291.1 thiamine ABC transporter ATP-binding protein [Candidatus Riesia pediculicola]
MIKAQSILYRYKDLSMFFNFQVEKGEKVSILGPNGSGKSTLLNLIAGFFRPNKGKILINNFDYTYSSPSFRPISIVFQNNNLFSHLTVLQNISLGVSCNLRLSVKNKRIVDEIIDIIDLNEQKNKFPNQISGGQKQLVALARCLIRKKPIMLLDEPFSSIDCNSKRKILKVLNRFCQKDGITLLVVLHDMKDASKMTNRSIILKNGAIIYDGKHKQFH